jgi:hypothetical protein
VSQIFKRFVFRKRPYTEDPPRSLNVRSKQARKDRTSSFPSRAVTLGVVLSYLVIASINYNQNPVPEGVFAWNFEVISFPITLSVMLVSMIAVSFGRIYVGVHYPSDCTVGGLLGGVILLISWGLYNIPVFQCPGCQMDMCYAADGKQITDYTQIYLLYPMLVLLIGCAACILLTSPPIHFWNKNAVVFGLSLGYLFFRTALLCPTSDSPYGLEKPTELTSNTIIIGVIITLFTWVFSLILGSLKFLKGEDDTSAIRCGSLTFHGSKNLLAFFGVTLVACAWLFSIRLSIA